MHTYVNSENPDVMSHNAFLCGGQLFNTLNKFMASVLSFIFTDFMYHGWKFKVSNSELSKLQS